MSDQDSGPVLVRLFPTSINWLLLHFLELSEDDRYLRFGFAIKDEQIKKYLESTLTNPSASRTDANFWFAIKIDNAICATLHIAIVGGKAEFAFTTNKEHRGKKLGQILFARGYQLINEYSIKVVTMQCLSVNAPMRHIARKFGMTVVTHGSDTDSIVNVQYPVPLSKIKEIVNAVIVDKDVYKYY